MKLNFWEKVLLFILAVLIVLAGGIRFLVLPSYEDFYRRTSDLMDTERKREIVQMSISGKNDLEKRYVASLQKALESSKPFFPDLDSDNLNKWLAELTARYGLAVQSFKAEKEKVTGFAQAPGTGSDSNIHYPIGDFADQINGNAPQKSGKGNNAASGAGSNVLESDVTLTLKGSYGGFTQFLDAVNQSGRTAIISAFDYRKNDSTASVTVNCYAVEKIGTGDPDWNWREQTPAGKSLM